MKHINFYLRILILTLFCLYVLICTYHVGLWAYHGSDKVRKCGVVTYKGTKDQINKHSTYNEFVLVVQYSKEKRDHHVSASTWSSFNVGDNICFVEDVNPNFFTDNLFGFIKFFLGFMGNFIIIIVILVIFIGWLITGRFVLIKKNDDD